MDVVQFVGLQIKGGHGAAEIGRRMEELPKFKGRIPLRRTLERLVKDLRENSRAATKTVAILDQPFEWHLMEEYGIPFEAGDYLLGLVRDWLEIDDAEHITQHPSARSVLWSWRIHLADPILTYYPVNMLALAFENRDYLNSLVGRPGFGFQDLEALLVYKPWTSEEMFQVYIRAVKENVIPFLLGATLEEAMEYSYFRRIHESQNLLAVFLLSFARGMMPEVANQRFREINESPEEVER